MRETEYNIGDEGKYTSMMELVDAHLRDAQKNKVFKDSEIRVGGSKKEMAALRKLSRFLLEDLNESENTYGEIAMIKFVKKAQVFPEFDIKQQKESGISSGAAFLKMKLRESYPGEPKIKTKESRKIYVGFANYLYDEFLNLPSVESVKNKQDKIASELKMIISKFLFEKEDYKETAKDLILAITAPYDEIQPRTDFISYEDAYSYTKDWYKNVLDRTNEYLGGAREYYWYNSYGIPGSEINLKGKLFLVNNSHYIRDNNLTALQDELRLLASDMVNKYYPRVNASATEDEKKQYTESLFEDLLKHITELSRREIINGEERVSWKIPSAPDPFWHLALKKIPELRDSKGRPIENCSGEDFILYFFSSSFQNFICYLGRGYAGVQHKNYLDAKSFEGISEDKSIVLTEECTRVMREELEKKQNILKVTYGCKSVFEFEQIAYPRIKEYSEPALPVGNFYSKRGQRLSANRDMYYYELNDDSDKSIWIELFKGKYERRITQLSKWIQDCYLSCKARPDDWSWAVDYLRSDTGIVNDGEEIKPQKRKIHSRPYLDYIERVGGLQIDKSKIDNIEHIKKYMTEFFGFKAYEFGKSLKDEDAREIIFHFLGAVSDLAEILDIDIRQINKLMGLSMGFASRGSGSASAHYESLGRIINLTRSSGDGSVAHEFAHYLDNIVPALDHINEYSYNQWATVQKSDKRYGAGSIKNPYVAGIFKEIMNFILYGIKGTTATEKVYVDYVATAEAAGDRTLTRKFMYEKIDDLVPLYRSAYPGMKYFEDWSRGALLIFDVYVRDAGLAEHTFRFPSRMSLYYKDSKNVGGDYWIRPVELFARAFEVYVADKLKAAGRKNNYLCNGEYNDAGTEYIPNYPYPQFEQRKYLFGLFEKMIKLLKSEYNLGDFVPFTNKKNGYTRQEILISKQGSPELEKYEKKLSMLMNILSGKRKPVTELGTGGELISRLKNQEGLAQFAYIYELFKKWNDAVSLYRKNEDGTYKTIIREEPLEVEQYGIGELTKKLIDELTAMYSSPEWPTIHKEVKKIASTVEKEQSLSELKEELMVIFAEHINSVFDKIEKGEIENSAGIREIYLYQLAIDSIASANSKKDLYDYNTNLVKDVIKSRNDIPGGKRQDLKINDLADEVESKIRKWYYAVQIDNNLIDGI